ncbi:hypothetical protein VKT23_014160 [Stygiomarasmius scandens]|uniref:CxC2-like cysteine cluster KDZ transposase-associated domain-containing protein n=1 Tax=Marasmiellus scandens TaxID=2682957 RepID=A0ABR1J496_9AGAR
MARGQKGLKLKPITPAERAVLDTSTKNISVASSAGPSANAGSRQYISETRPVNLDSTAKTPQDSVPVDDVSGTSAKASQDSVLHDVQGRARTYGASTYMLPFLGVLFFWVKYLFRGDHDERLNTPCTCGIRKRTVRCADCLFAPCTCETCFVQLHLHNPTHWADIWDPEKGHFVRKDICQLGYVFTFGHNGSQCRHVNYKTDAKWFTVVDVNGMHRTRIAFCKCRSGLDQMDLLLQSGIFPATNDNPETGFTFALLELYNLETLVAKKSAHDICIVLGCRTSYDFPTESPDVHLQFLRVMRVWRALQMYKQSGQGHNIDEVFQTVVPGWPKRSMIVPCYACPQPGFNMEEEVLDEDEMKHLETLFLSADGHFGLQRKAKTDDPDDVALTKDMGLFPKHDEYEHYSKTCNATVEVNITLMQKRVTHYMFD